MRRQRTRVWVTLFCMLFCLFSAGGGGFYGAQEVAASSIRSCAGANKVVVAAGAKGTINPETGLCEGMEMTNCRGWIF